MLFRRGPLYEVLAWEQFSTAFTRLPDNDISARNILDKQAGTEMYTAWLFIICYSADQPQQMDTIRFVVARLLTSTMWKESLMNIEGIHGTFDDISGFCLSTGARAQGVMYGTSLLCGFCFHRQYSLPTRLFRMYLPCRSGFITGCYFSNSGGGWYATKVTFCVSLVWLDS